MEILYKKEKEEADQLLEQQRLVSLINLSLSGEHLELFSLFTTLDDPEKFAK